jgi:transcriptional repressor NrdR
MVIKKSGEKKPFSREKILLGMTKSFGKKQIQEQKLEEAVDEIVQEIHKHGVSEIKTSLIGNLVLEKLYKLDLVAYIRFASVFKEFKDFAGFRQEIELLNKKKRVKR